MLSIAIISTILKPFMNLFLFIFIAMGFKVFLIYMKYRNSKYGAASGNSFFKTIYDKGNYGEFLTFQFLEKIPGDNKILTNIYIPREDGTTTEVDLLMLNKSGVYVFESKNYSGWIFGDEKNKNWTQSLKGGKKNKFFNPVWQNKAHINALIKSINEIDSRYFYSYIVFSERCELKKVSVTNPNIHVVKRNKLFSILMKDISERTEILSESQIDKVFEILQNYILVDIEMKEMHIENIKSKI